MAKVMASVVVLGRAPEPGRVKRRLARSVGDDQALEVYRWLLARTLAVATDSGMPVWFFATDDLNPSVRRLGQEFGCQVSRQPDGDLGARMAQAFAAVHQHSRQVILVGTDCPVLSTADLWQLAGAVAAGGISAIAAEDGGYVALASGAGRLWQEHNPLQNVAWGSETALSDTESSLRRYEERVTICGRKWDLDTEADLARARAEGILPL